MRHFLAARLMLMSLVETRKKLSVKEVRAEIPLGYKIKLENVLPIFFYYLEPPIITSKPPTQVSVVQGSTLSLCCEATGSPPPRCSGHVFIVLLTQHRRLSKKDVLKLTRSGTTVTEITCVKPKTVLD